MKKNMVLFAVLLLIALAPVVYSASEMHGSTKLLALMSKEGKQYGASATLDLDIQPGKNRVFLETFPLTQVTTQVSMRFAQQIACDQIDVDCSDYDFFYTIKALPGVVGGPSAGASAAVLAASLLLEQEMKKDTAVTGTINSGGTIGAVGGLKGKIKAASENGITHVLIPKGTRMYAEDEVEVVDIKKEPEKNKTNESFELNQSNKLDLVEYGKNLSINVTEVATLAEALEIFTGYKIKEPVGEFVIDPAYKATMKAVAIDLCSRNQNITKQLKSLREELDKNTSEKEIKALNYSEKSKESFDLGEYYSAASYCFRSSVSLKQDIFKLSNLSKEDIENQAKVLEESIDEFDKKINSTKMNTITALQTMMAVKERLQEARDAVTDALESEKLNKSNDMMAYAEERLHSAKTWSKFFNGDENEFELDKTHLKSTCKSKINEAEERYNYIRSILPNMKLVSRKEMDKAYEDLDNGKYVDCLYQAIKLKSEIDVVLAVIGVEDKELDELIDLKLDIVRKSLIKAEQKGIFPIISYSYYEYANSLKEKDKFSALLFTGYALEFANLDIYFPKKRTVQDIIKRVDRKMLLIFFLGLFAGILLMWSTKKEHKTLQTSPKKRLRGKKR
ncbi:hypothetical protein KY338_00675 [Candidatus Woesearchaeota archaeon]|nr:hypothetical protein [Candidatus Woesearchaeota archaeon]MBW3005166.1 hypothetical protein [Candidatus Woesearchaeota archaeon]